MLFHSHYNHAKMGGQKSLLALIDNLDRKRIKPYLVIPNDGDLRLLAEKRGVEVLIKSVPGFKPINFFKLKNVRDQFVDYINENNIKLIHSDNVKFSYFSSFVAKKAKIKSIYHARVTSWRKYDKQMEGRIDKIIGISEATKVRFKSLAETDKYTIIYNGVDCEKFNENYDKFELRDRLEIEKDKKILVFVGQIKKTKGLGDIIDAINILPNSEDLKLYVLGSEPQPGLKQEFIDMIEKHKLNNVINLVGQKSNVNEWLQAADLVLFPSHEGAEGMGRVPFEAMATSTPVIATNISGVNEAVNSDVGILVEQESPEQLAEAITKLLNDEELYNRLATNGRKRALELFDIKVHAKNMMDLFEEMVNENEN